MRKVIVVTDKFIENTKKKCLLSRYLVEIGVRIELKPENYARIKAVIKADKEHFYKKFLKI